MTTVYGVTFIGARDQIEKQLKDKKELKEEETWGAASYLAKKVSLVPNLGSRADLITSTSGSASHRRSVFWRHRHSKLAEYHRTLNLKIHSSRTPS